MKIQANYDDLAQIANRFAQESSQSADLAQKVNGLVNDLQGGGWIGRGADAFYSEMFDEVMPAMQRLVQALEDGSQTLKRISDMMSQAENEASGLFAQLT